METTTGNKKNFRKKDYYRPKNEERKKRKLDKLLVEIESLGIKPQINSIASQGFDNIKKIYKEFMKNDKDVEKTIASLKLKEEKRAQKMAKKEQKRKSLEETVKNLNLTDQIELIKTKFPKLSLKKILLALSRNENNPTKAIEYLSSNTHFKRKDAKYKELFPEDKERDWGKYKEKKKELKLIRKQEKAEKKQKWKEEKEKREANLKTVISEGITQLYLDGNNMLFLDSTIRALCLGKEMKRACEILAELFYIYTSHKRFNAILIFDNGKVVFEKESDGVTFKVCTARPKYETSDDALVDWAGGLSASDLASSLFVTSDRGLLTRLIEKGATQVMKSGNWWKIVKEYVGDTLYQEIINKK